MATDERVDRCLEAYFAEACITSDWQRKIIHDHMKNLPCQSCATDTCLWEFDPWLWKKLWVSICNTPR